MAFAQITSELIDLVNSYQRSVSEFEKIPVTCNAELTFLYQFLSPLRQDFLKELQKFFASIIFDDPFQESSAELINEIVPWLDLKVIDMYVKRCINSESTSKNQIEDESENA